jgi:hypothetical protein
VKYRIANINIAVVDAIHNQSPTRAADLDVQPEEEM